MTSVACWSTDGGMVSPSARAVLRFTTQVDRRHLLNWQIGRPGPLQDLVDVGGSTPVQGRRIHPVRDEPAGRHEGRILRHQRQVGDGGERDDPLGLEVDQRRVGRQQRLNLLLNGYAERWREVRRLAELWPDDLHAEPLSGLLKLPQGQVSVDLGNGDVLQEQQSRKAWNHILQHLEALLLKPDGLVAHARHIAARPGQAVYKSGT